MPTRSERADALIRQALRENDDDLELEPAEIQGEYWWINGHLEFADGDVGDQNHESIAIEHARALVVDALGLDFDSESDDWWELIMDHVGKSSLADENAISELVRLTNLSPDEVNVALGRGQPRNVAIRLWKWIRIKGDNFDVPNLAMEWLKKAAQAASDVLSDEGVGEGDDLYDETHFIRLYDLSGHSVDASIEALRQGRLDYDPMDRAEREALQRSADQQVKAMDVKAMHSAYQGKMGDGIAQRADALVACILEFDYEGLRFRYSAQPGIENPQEHRIDASNGQGAVGYIVWDADDGEISHIFVGNSIRRMGIGTILWEKATEVSEENGWEPPCHSSARSFEGDALAQSIGGHIPDLTDDVNGWSTSQ